MVYIQKKVWQFQDIEDFVETNGTFQKAEPFMPGNMNVLPKENGYRVAGFYGEDWATNHSFTVKDLDGEIRTYTDFENIPRRIKHLISFKPDDTHDRTFVYYFSDGSVLEHDVHNDHSRWTERIKQIISREI